MDNTPKIYSAIATAMGEIAKEGISKSRENKLQSYKFRGIDDVYNALSPILAKSKIVILPRVLSRDCVERSSSKGGAIFYTVLDVEFDFVCAEDGSKHTVRTAGEAMDSSDKSTNKAMSAAFKYACMQVFCIPTEGDNDSENDTIEVTHNLITEEQVNTILDLTLATNTNIEAMCKFYKVNRIEEIKSNQYDSVIAKLKQKLKNNTQANDAKPSQEVA